jgi:Tfp pilus assembly protein PilV
MTMRQAYTLFEVLVSLVIAVLLMGALYAAVELQLRSAQLGRDAVNQTTLSRALLTRMENDVASTVALCDPGRFRSLPKTSSSTTPTTTTTTSTPSSTTSTTGMATEAEAADSTSGAATDGMGLTGPVMLPLGVMGDSTSLTLFVSKVPGEVYGVRPGEPGQLVSDVRRVTYWVGEGGAGLCRQEIRIATAEEALNSELPSGDVAAFLLAPEVKSLEIRYFDGSSWVDSWDSTATGDDGVTPVGSPRAIEVRLGFLRQGSTDENDLKYHRHVIAIPTSNGITQAGNVQAAMEAGTAP